MAIVCGAVETEGWQQKGNGGQDDSNYKCGEIIILQVSIEIDEYVDCSSKIST